jgi:hypothetical protein
MNIGCIGMVSCILGMCRLEEVEIEDCVRREVFGFAKCGKVAVGLG